MNYWDRLYLSPDFGLVIFLTVLIFIFLVVYIVGGWNQWKIRQNLQQIVEKDSQIMKTNKQIAKSLLVIRAILKHEEKEIMNMFDEIVQESSEHSEISGNQNLKKQVLSQAFKDAKSQNTGLAELITLLTFMQANMAQRNDTGELIKAAKEHLRSEQSKYTDETKNLIEKALNDPEVLSIALSQQQELKGAEQNETPVSCEEENTSQDTDLQESVDISEEPLLDTPVYTSDEDLLNADQVRYNQEAFVRRDLPIYRCVVSLFNAHNVDICGNWEFEYLDKHLFNSLYGTLNGKRNTDVTAGEIADFLKQFR